MHMHDHKFVSTGNHFLSAFLGTMDARISRHTASTRANSVPPGPMSACVPKHASDKDRYRGEKLVPVFHLRGH